MRNVLSKEDLEIATKQLSKNHDHNWVKIGGVGARILAVDYHSSSIPRILIHGLNSNNVSYTSLLKWSKNRKRNGKIYLSSYFPPPRKDNSDQFNAQWVSLSDVEEFYHNPNDQYDSINIGDSVKVVVRGTWHIAKVVGMYSYWVKESEKSHTILALDVPEHNDFKSSKFYSHHGMLDPNFKGEKVFLANSLFIGNVVKKAPQIQADKNNIRVGDFVTVDLGNRAEKAIVKTSSEDEIEYLLAKEAHLKYDNKSYFHKAKYDKVKTSIPRDLKIKEQETIEKEVFDLGLSTEHTMYYSGHCVRSGPDPFIVFKSGISCSLAFDGDNVIVKDLDGKHHLVDKSTIINHDHVELKSEYGSIRHYFSGDKKFLWANQFEVTQSEFEFLKVNNVIRAGDQTDLWWAGVVIHSNWSNGNWWSTNKDGTISVNFNDKIYNLNQNRGANYHSDLGVFNKHLRRFEKSDYLNNIRVERYLDSGNTTSYLLNKKYPSILHSEIGPALLGPSIEKYYLFGQEIASREEWLVQKEKTENWFGMKVSKPEKQYLESIVVKDRYWTNYLDVNKNIIARAHDHHPGVIFHISQVDRRTCKVSCSDGKVYDLTFDDVKNESSFWNYYSTQEDGIRIVFGHDDGIWIEKDHGNDLYENFDFNGKVVSRFFQGRHCTEQEFEKWKNHFAIHVIVKNFVQQEVVAAKQETNYPLEAIYRVSARKILASSKSLIEKFISQSSNVSISKIGSLLETNIGNALVGYFAASYLQSKIKNSPRITKLIEEIRLESMISVSESTINQIISSFSQDEIQEQFRLLEPIENLIPDQMEEIVEIEEVSLAVLQN